MAPLRVFLLFLFLSAAHAKQYEFSFETRENAPVRTQVGDLKRGPSGQRLLPSDLEGARTYVRKPACDQRFVVDTKSALVLVKSAIDRESICPDLQTLAGTSPPASGAASRCVCTLRIINRAVDVIKVHVTVLDENDHSPHFPSPVKFITVSEAAAEGYEQSLEPASDPDLPPNTVERYTLARAGRGSTADVTATFAVRFEAASSELKLLLKAPLDYERVRQYNATLDACDAGRPERCGSQLLVINVRDENDNGPRFDAARIEADVAENATEGFVVVRARARDLDSGENGRLVYRKKAGSGRDAGGGASHFGVNEETGEVYVQRPLRFSRLGAAPIAVQVEASDHGSPVRKAVAVVLIRVRDVNDRSPAIQVRSRAGGGRAELMEDAPRETVVAHLFVSDADDPDSEGGRFRCWLRDDGGAARFRLDLASRERVSSIYRLATAAVFDRETEDEVTVHVVCRDGGGLESSKDVPVAILDRNEFKPSFDGTPYEAHVPENGPASHLVLQVKASDADRTAQLLYSLDREGAQYFSIVAETGEIFTRRPLDRELVASLRFAVHVTDSVATKGRHVGRANVTVFVDDANDNAPTVSDPLSFTVDENVPDSAGRASFRVGRLHAIDADDGDNGRVAFRLVRIRVAPPARHRGAPGPAQPPPPPPNDTFHLREDGTLLLRRPLDRELHEQLLLDVRVSDRGSPPQVTSAIVSITVRDANDNPPAWRHPTTQENAKNISSLARAGYVVTRVRAVDPDFESRVTYSLVEGGRHFSVHADDGEVRIRTALAPGLYRLKFRASDNGAPRRSSDIEYLVRVYYQAPFPQGGVAGSYAGMNLPLIVAMIAVTCIICVSLVIAIVVVRRKSSVRRPPTPDDGYGGAAESTQKWVQEGVNGSGPGSNQGSIYAPGQHWMRPEIYSTAAATSPAVSAACYHGNSVDKYHHNSASAPGGHQSQMLRMHGLPVDMEVASADSGHGASEEEAGAEQRSKELRLCAQRTPCPILPEDSVVQCGCSSSAGAAVGPPTTSVAGQHPFHSFADFSRTLDLSGARALPLVGLSGTLGPSMSSFRSFPVAVPPARHGSIPSGTLPERRPSQSNV